MITVSVDSRTPKNFRENVTRIMAMLGISQLQLAEKTGLARPYLNRVLRGKTEPGMGLADVVAPVIGVENPELLFRDPEKFGRKVAKAS